jgi:ribosome-associated toxin RatA of RatAB toxin-antitoxin module
VPHISRSALVPYSAAAMFRLVDDVDAYAEFLPWCASSKEHARSDDAVVAELEIARAGVAQRFTTRNARTPPERLTLELVEGPFEWFAGEWRFRPLAEDACKVELEMDFEYAGRLVRTALGPFFDRSADTLVDAFCARAKSVYGAPA